MANRLTLTLPPGFGSREVEVVGRRFSIGRIPENDLVLDDASLSRWHALIENFDGVFNLSDCGSSNGTLINGEVVTGAAELRDSDVLTFGGVGDVLVRVRDAEQASPLAAEPTHLRAGASAQYTATPFKDHVTPGPARAVNVVDFWLSAPVIAISASLLILLVAGLVLLVTKGGSSSRPDPKSGIVRKQQPVLERNDNSPNGNDATPGETTPSPDTTTDANSGDATDAGAVDLAPIEAAASDLLSSISKDTHPVLTEKPVREIYAQIQRYRTSPSSLRDELRAMKRDAVAISAIAKSNGLRTPLAVYATLATIDSAGGRGEPTQVAGQICPTLAKMRRIFGDELANDSLLTVAALEEGPSLQLRVTKLAGQVKDSPTTIRSVWYLHEHKVLKEETYSFVLRFLAIGVIAQNPQKFGIAADALTF